MNFNRSNYLKNNILPYLCKYKLIKEIIISHGKKENYFEYKDKKIKNLKDWDKNEEYKLTLRFLNATKASYENILILDDDILPSEKAVNTLFASITDDKDNIYGLYGRNLNDNFDYSVKINFGECHIILTRCLMTTKKMCNIFIEEFLKGNFDEVKNNGEDILFSFLSIRENNKLPIAYNLPHTNRNFLYELIERDGISFDKNHIKKRSEISKKYIKKLNIEEKIIPKNEGKINWLYEFYNSYLPLYILLLMFFLLFIYWYIKFRKL